MQTKNKSILQWQYYWHYRLQVKLNHEHPHEWAFFALWGFNSIILHGLIVIMSKHIPALRNLLIAGDSALIIFYSVMAFVAYFITRLVYGNEKYRVYYCDEIEISENDFKYIWFNFVYIIFTISFMMFSVNYAY